MDYIKRSRGLPADEQGFPPPLPAPQVNTASNHDVPHSPLSANSGGVLSRGADGNLRLPAAVPGQLLTPMAAATPGGSLAVPSPASADRIMLGFPSPAELTAPSTTAPLHRRRPSRNMAQNAGSNTTLSLTTSTSFSGGGGGTNGTSPGGGSTGNGPNSASDRPIGDPKKTDSEVVPESAPLLSAGLTQAFGGPGVHAHHSRHKSSDDEYVPPVSLPIISQQRVQRRSRPHISPAKQKGSAFPAPSPWLTWANIARSARHFVVFYVVVSVCFTTWKLLGAFRQGDSREQALGDATDADDLEMDKTIALGRNGGAPYFSNPNPAPPSEVRMEKSVPGGGTVVVRVGINDQERPSNLGIYSNMPDQYLIHKLFAHALRPVKIEPFFLRAASAPKSRDITVATIMDPSRMDNFLRLVEQYHGPISVAVHVTENYNNVSNIIADLERVYRSHPVVAQRVDMHLVIDKYDRQFNLWRNVARFYARSDFILQLDVDFVIPTNMARTFAEHPEYLNNIDEHRTIYVLPAFEFAQNSASAASMEKAEEFPRTKERLAEAWHDNRIKQFHDFFPVGHKSTDYPRWFGSDEPYAIQDYSFKYEPYVVMKKDETPWCDERFVGYGANKAACFFELFLAGYRFLVLPRDFVIHQRHAYPEEDRRIERNYNRELYRRFREEACVKYNLMWAEHGTRTDQEGIRASATRGEERIVEDYLGCNGLIGAAPPPPGYVPIEQCDVKDTWIKKQS